MKQKTTEITPMLRKAFKEYVTHIGGTNLAWENFHKHISESPFEKHTVIADILAGLSYTSPSKTHQVGYVHKKLSETFTEEMKRLHPFTLSPPPLSLPTPIQITDMDEYARTWMTWYTNGTVTGCTFQELMSHVYLIFPTPYELGYITNELWEMIKLKEPNKEFILFNKYRSRQKKLNPDDPASKKEDQNNDLQQITT